MFLVRFFFLSACVCALEACGGEHVSTGPFEPGRYLTTATFAPVAGDSPVCDSNAASAAPLAAACCPAVEQSTRKLAHDANGYAFTSDDSVASPPFAATRNDNVLMWKEFSNLMAADIDPCADYPVKAYVW